MNVEHDSSQVLIVTGHSFGQQALNAAPNRYFVECEWAFELNDHSLGVC